jgi:hypothetical protein
MPEAPEYFEEARPRVAEAKRKLLERFGSDRNVVGARYGQPEREGERLDEPACVVHVVRKVPKDRLPASALIPAAIDVDGRPVRVDVIETGPAYLQSYILRERPVRSGISIGHPLVGYGTLGCYVRDNRDGALCMLSNNHVIAANNLASDGDPILQPGPGNGGTTLNDKVAFLKRRINLNFNTGRNSVDCAIGPDDRRRLRRHGQRHEPP